MTPAKFKECVKKIQTIEPNMDTTTALFFIFEYRRDLAKSTPQRVWHSLSFVNVDLGIFSVQKYYRLRANLFKYIHLNLFSWTFRKLVDTVNN